MCLPDDRRVGAFFFFSSRRRHTRSDRDWSSDVCSSDLKQKTAYGSDRDWSSDVCSSDQNGRAHVWNTVKISVVAVSLKKKKKKNRSKTTMERSRDYSTYKNMRGHTYRCSWRTMR